MDEANQNTKKAYVQLKEASEKSGERNKKLGYGCLAVLVLCFILFMGIVGNPFSSDSDEDLGIP